MVRRRSRFALACVVLGAATLLALGGCEVIVGSSLGSVPCVEGPGACPEGQACVAGTCTVCAGCSPFPDVAVPDGGFEAASDVITVDEEPPPTDGQPRDVVGRDARDAGHDGSDAKVEDSGLKPVGATCTAASQCQSGVCGDTTLLGGVSPPGVCTEACCTSSDCPAGFVCYPCVGGNYCVAPASVGLSTPGTGAAGAACSSGSTCKSSVCTSNVCQDTCCTDSDCTSPTVCQASAFDDGVSYSCGPSNDMGTQGDECSFQDCESNQCVGDFSDSYCLGPCCSDADCSIDANDVQTTCNWVSVTLDAGTANTRSCTEPLNPGGAAFNAACTTNDDCVSGLCYGGTTCTKPCCPSNPSAACGTQACAWASFAGSIDLEVCIP